MKWTWLIIKPTSISMVITVLLHEKKHRKLQIQASRWLLFLFLAVQQSMVFEAPVIKLKPQTSYIKHDRTDGAGLLGGFGC